MNLDYAKRIILKGGGIITCGQHLGVFISSPENISICPPGWIFVDVTTTTPDQILLAVEHLQSWKKHLA